MAGIKQYTGLLMAALITSGCSFFSADKPPGDIPVTFTDLEAGDNCLYQLNVNGEQWNLDYLAFYLSQPRLKIDGRWQPVAFKPGPWQSKKLALMQFHSACNTEANHTVIKLDTNQQLLDRASAIQFTLGVPFDSNHVISDHQAPPLNNSVMFQSIRQGHSFMRIELQQASAQAGLWSFMLASGECQGSNDDETPQQCDKPNRITLDLPLKANVQDLRLVAKLSQILFRADMPVGQECNLAGQYAQSCRKVLRNLTSREWIRWDAPHQAYLKQD